MSHPETVAAIFALTYVGIALGGVPGLALDRTGIALLGAIAMVATGALNPEEAAKAIDAPTIILLYSLMVLSGQLRLSGFYTAAALKANRFIGKPASFLGAVMLIAAVLSALLANDIVCLALTPVICFSLLEADMNPVPFLLGLACASNIGSAATIIGNPQNMLIGQVAGLHFDGFLLWCGPPSVVCLGAAYLVILMLFKGKWKRKDGRDAAPAGQISKEEWPPYDRHQSVKGLVIACALLVMFFTPVPRELSAVIAAGVLLASRKIETRQILGMVDWHLITLFCALFIVVAGVSKYGMPRQAVSWLEGRGVDINAPYVLSLVTLVLSNILSNVPAVMLILKHINLAATKNLYVLALISTYAGNLLIVGSIANLITIEQAKSFGVRIGFREHARVGVPVTVLSMLIAFAWIAVAA